MNLARSVQVFVPLMKDNCCWFNSALLKLLTLALDCYGETSGVSLEVGAGLLLETQLYVR